MKKTKVFNVVILDKSGSMGRIWQSAIDGFNEVLSGICHSQTSYAETQEQFVTLVVFSGEEIKIVYDNMPVAQTHSLAANDLIPHGMTPLNDAIGLTLCRTESHIKEMDDVAVVVTIITDGEENASKEYTYSQVQNLVNDLRRKGWAFTFLGANQDSYRTANNVGIRNARNFTYDDEGVSGAFSFARRWSTDFSQRLNCYKRKVAETGVNLSNRELQKQYSAMADEIFDEEEKKEDDMGTGH